MNKSNSKHFTRNYFKNNKTHNQNNLIPTSGSGKKNLPKKKKVIKQNIIISKESKVPLGAKIKRNKVLSGNQFSANSKTRSGSNKSLTRKIQFNYLPSAVNIEKHALRTTSNGSNSREKSGSRKLRINNKPNTIIKGWTNNLEMHSFGKRNIKNSEQRPNKSKIPTKIPKISRHTVSNTAFSTNKNKRNKENSIDKNFIGIQYERTNTQGNLKQALFSPQEKVINQGFNSERSYNNNLQKANFEISILKDKLKKKNNELLKLKKFSKIKDK